MTKNTMTYREFYNTIATMDGMDEAMVEFATKAIAALDRKNANRKTGTSKTAKENAALREKVRTILATEAKPAKAIAKELEAMAAAEGTEKEFSTQKVSAIIRSFDEGEIVVTKGKDAKGNTVNFYGLGAEGENEPEDEPAE